MLDNGCRKWVYTTSDRRAAGGSTRCRLMLAAWVFVGLSAVAARPVWAEPTTAQEYQVKAAFLYNFLLFVDGFQFVRTDNPTGKPSDANEPVAIAVIGKDPFQGALEPLQQKQVNSRGVVIKRFKGLSELAAADPTAKITAHPQMDDIRKCHLVFICQSERQYAADLLAAVRQYPVLTVSDVDGFMDAGGIIFFVIEDNKVRFEVNLAAAKRAKLTIRSKLLRLARRFVEQDKVGGN